MPAFEYHATVTVKIRNGKRFKLEAFKLPMGRRGQLMLRCDGKNSRHGQTTCTAVGDKIGSFLTNQLWPKK